jgi:hypothetical protein
VRIRGAAVAKIVRTDRLKHHFRQNEVIKEIFWPKRNILAETSMIKLQGVQKILKRAGKPFGNGLKWPTARTARLGSGAPSTSA